MELIKVTKPFYSKPYKIPKVYEEMTCKEVDRLAKIGLLNQIKTSKWVALCFIIPKKDGTTRFMTDLRGLNKFLKRENHILTWIDNIMISVENFVWTTVLDLSMGYYAMIVSMAARNYYVIVLPWGVMHIHYITNGTLN